MALRLEPERARKATATPQCSYTPKFATKPDIGRVQEWLGHANISTTRMYYRLRPKVEEGPSFKVRY